MRTIKQIHSAEYSSISNLETHIALPTKSIEYIDPFLFLNHRGPQVYPANNNGLTISSSTDCILLLGYAQPLMSLLYLGFFHNEYQ